MLKCRDDAGNRLGSKKKSEKESKTHVASTDAKNSKNLFFKWPPPAPSRKTLEWFAKGSPGDVSDKLVLGLNVSEL